MSFCIPCTITVDTLRRYYDERTDEWDTDPPEVPGHCSLNCTCQHKPLGSWKGEGVKEDD